MAYTPVSSTVSGGDTATATQYNNVRTDALAMLPRDGSEAMAATLDMGTNKIENLAAITDQVPLTPSGNIANGALRITNTSNADQGIYCYTNMGSGANDPLVEITVDNSSFDQAGLKVTNDGALAGIYIDNNGTNGLQIENTGTVNRGFYLYSNHASPSYSLAEIHIDNASAAVHSLELKNDGTGSAMQAFRNSSTATAFGVGYFKQDNTIGKAPCLGLSQDDADFEFINFIGTAGAGNSIDTNTTSGAVSGHIKIAINGTDAWIPYSTVAPS